MQLIFFIQTFDLIKNKNIFTGCTIVNKIKKFNALRCFCAQLDHFYGGGSAVGKHVCDRSCEHVVADPSVSCQNQTASVRTILVFSWFPLWISDLMASSPSPDYNSHNVYLASFFLYSPSCFLKPPYVSGFLMVEQTKTCGDERRRILESSVTKPAATSGSYTTSAAPRGVETNQSTRWQQ